MGDLLYLGQISSFLQTANIRLLTYIYASIIVVSATFASLVAIGSHPYVLLGKVR